VGACSVPRQSNACPARARTVQNTDVDLELLRLEEDLRVARERGITGCRRATVIAQFSCGPLGARLLSGLVRHAAKECLAARLQAGLGRLPFALLGLLQALSC
jgi:hypothetical protein